MAQRFFSLARQAGRARSQLLALTAASAGVAAYGISDERNYMFSRFTLPGLTPVAFADVKPEAQTAKTARIALVGFEDVKDVSGFVSSALEKTLKYAKSSPLQSMVSSKKAAPATSSSSSKAFGEQVPPATIDPASFYTLLEKQPLSEKVMVLDDIVDSVIREAERSAEVSGLTVGMVGAGLACYALVGWAGDLALPGAGSIACSAVAGAAGHNRAVAAAKRTRSRFLSAILDNPVEGHNTFVDYLAAPSLDVKQRIASETKPAVFFRDFFVAVQPLLKQVAPLDTTEAVMGTAA